APDGRLVGFRHVIPEAAPGARLTRDEAHRIAEEFLRGQTGAPHRLVEEQLQERPERYDYVFTWEQEGFRVKDATYRRTVVIQGGDVGRYSEYLHVPERWTREYQRLRSANELYAAIAWALFAVLIVAAIAVLVRALRRREIRWTPLLAVCGAVGAVAVLNEWNLLPFYVDSMPTSSTFGEMVALSLLSGLGTGVGYLAYVLLAAAAGVALYRWSAPERLALPKVFSARGLQTREFFRGAVAGLGFAGAHMAYVVGFYLLGKRFGVWTPQDVGYSDVLSTAAPWLYPMAVGVLASTSEEFWFRLLAIPLLKRYLKSSWLAVLIPAFVWGFLHANYPQQPGYIRGIEVGIIGVAAGWLFLRFGIVATLVWHYTIDAVLVSTMLFEAQGWHFRLSGILVSAAVLAPLGYCLWRYRRRGGFLVEEELLNRAEAPEVAREAPVRQVPGDPIRGAWPVRYLYLAAAAALAAGWWVKPVVFGDFIEIKIPRAEALRIADAALTGRGEDPATWRRAVTFLPNLSLEDFEYLRQTAGPEAANRIVEERTFHGVWYVRYVRPIERQEWRVYVRQDGRAYRVDHLLAETDPGADLPEDEALATAHDYVTREQQIDLGRYRLVSSNSEKRERRRDYDFVWEDTQFRVGEARARLSLSLLGDEPAFFRKFLKLPEEWLRAYRRPRLQQ
ncbi:MAG TPA: CPBP family intramembrane metalloprotease, partial [Bryobacterales bacterium]|nr:CPBP family intramembrane metalloprotease [Bryobacterales bacterium]